LLRSSFLALSCEPSALFGVLLDEDAQRPVLGRANVFHLDYVEAV
jgi:hypothetical protein